ncbi:MAG: hypothetical protein Tsb008_10660 [Rhodothalassiaceae bacterium]
MAGLSARLRRSLLTGSAFGLAIMASSAALAQEQQAGDENEVEEIVVTGSRISRDPNATAPVPVQMLSGKDIVSSGNIDAADVLRDIPSLFTSVSSESSIDSVFSSSVGQSILQLRGMGAERTLVLVNGRRHVSGVEGSQSVDVGSIPSTLIERVEVLTGGASALYGADAVTGVVNFILRDNFEGLELNAQGSISDQADGETYRLSAVYGLNFAEDRGNVAVAADYTKREKLLFGDRSFSRNNGIGRNLPNPDLRFQLGDIDPSTTPNFAQFFSLDNGLFPRGFRIPSVEDFVADFFDTFGVAPNLTAAELALIERAQNAPARKILRQPTFSISSNRGVIAPGDFSSPDIDLDGNGVRDCEQSSVGFNSSLDFAGAFGLAGGCWVVNDDGSVRPFNDGLITGVFNQFGGDGIQDNFDASFLTPSDEKINLNLLGHYDFSEAATVFIEAKYSRQSTRFGTPLNTFYDLLTVAPDNPFIPEELFDLAQDTGGLFVTRDPTDLGPNIDTNRRDTYRIVAGLKGDLENGWNYEVSGNYGRFERNLIDRNSVLVDRFFAAIDVTTDANGNPICRSDIDPTPPPTTPFDIPLFDSGFFTFNPGDGQCKPANILGGPNSISQEAVDFITTTTRSKFELEQVVFSAFLAGNSSNYFELPAGAIGFAVGAEYRDEKSTSTFDPLDRGVLPVDGPEGSAGTLLSELEDFRQTALTFDPANLIQNSAGSYDVWDVFAEISIPVIKDVFLIEDLTIDGAVRYSDYSTIGGATTWKFGGTWQPVQDLRVRGTYSKAVRAPNIFELFDPDQGAFFRPNDPCDQTAIDALKASGDPRGPIREANCRAAGIPEGFTDPLSARFSGVTSGNRNLQEESAKTWTLGAVIQPNALAGLTLTVDYWNIDITDAIASVSAQDIVDNCFDSPNFPNQFCDLFSRNQDPSSPQFLGFNFLRQTQVNFGSIRSAGVDFQGRYAFDIEENAFTVGISATFVDKLNFFFDPGDPTAVDPELLEIQRPRWAGTMSLEWTRGPFALGWTTQYMGRQNLRGVEIEDIDINFGPAGQVSRLFIHDLRGSYELSDSIQIYGGVNNVADRKPFITEQTYPVSPIGRSFFLGVTARY